MLRKQRVGPNRSITITPFLTFTQWVPAQVESLIWLPSYALFPPEEPMHSSSIPSGCSVSPPKSYMGPVGTRHPAWKGSPWHLSSAMVFSSGFLSREALLPSCLTYSAITYFDVLLVSNFPLSS